MRWHLPCDLRLITKRGQDAAMKRWRLSAALGVAWLTLAWVTGCSRQLAVPGSKATANSGQLPFDRVSDNGGLSPTTGFASDGIPAGIAITIRLQMALSSADARAGDTFQAVLDEPLVVAGKTMVPRGTLVTGNVVAARAFGSLNEPGYLRLTLASMMENGNSVALQTSSVFAKGGSYGKGSAAEPAMDSMDGTGISIHSGEGDVRFSTGRRLTFRLAQPLH
jgi:hypothetical protein